MQRSARHTSATVALLLLVATGIAACHSKPAGEPAPLRMTISGLLSPKVIARDADDLNRYFGELWSRPVRVTSVRDPVLAATQLAAGELDVALLSPLRFVIARREVPELTPLARIVLSGAESYEGVLVTRRSAGLASLEELRGKRVCWTSTSSTSGYLYPRALLRGHGLDPDAIFSQTLFTGSHAESLRALVGERCDVAATYPVAYMRDFKDAPPQTFSPIATTSAIPYDPVVVRPDLDSATVAAMRQALLTAEPRHLVLPAELALHRLTRYHPASQSDYEEVARVLAGELAAREPEQPF